jgi:uncharacterized protein
MANPSVEDIRAVMNGKGELALRVVPGAKVERAAIENGALKLWTRTAPEDGKATKAVLAQVADLLGVPVRDVVLVSGATSREKRVRVDKA